MSVFLNLKMKPVLGTGVVYALVEKHSRKYGFTNFMADLLID